MSTETFRWGILGAGQIAVKFCDAVKSIADCTVAAVGSKSFSRAETFARENGISRWYGDYEELLKKERPDAVYIAATSNDHYRLTMMALDYEIPVLCEKAMFQNSGQASVVFARSEKEKVFVMEAMWSRFLPAVRTAAKWLEQGRIGKVTAAEAAIGFLAPYDPSNRYFSPALGGGAALDLTVYTFELLTGFFGNGFCCTDITVYPSETGVDETGSDRLYPGEADTEQRGSAQRYQGMRGWLGFSEANGKFKEIIDLYNSVKPLPRGYAVQYSDEWCDTCVSAAGIKAGCSELIGRECGVEEHVKIFKKLGIWIEDGTITPEPGYVIVYNWDKAAQPNDGYSDHIGFVEKVSGGMITAIEGNRGEKVARRVIPLGWGYIRGYAAPQYEKAVNGNGGNPGTGKKSVEAVAKEVLAGKWGNGEDRKKRLQDAGYDYGAVQRKVNELMR